MKFLVTGGAGFIGSSIVERLLLDKHDVVVLDNLFSGRLENIAEFLGRVRFIEGDITDKYTVDEAVNGIDYIFHEAAIPSVQRSLDDPERSNLINVDGTLNILLAAKKHGVKRVVLAGSSSVYGDTEVLPKVETMPLNPLSPYAVTKAVGELYSKSFSSLYDIETVVLRYFNVFGPRQDPLSHYLAVIPKFISLLIKGESPTIYGDGEQSRDFTYIDNIVHANMLALRAPSKNVSGKVFNIACGTRISLNSLIVALNKLLGTKVVPRYTAAKKGDVKHSLANVNLAAKSMSYAPIVSLEGGLEKTVEYFKEVSKAA